MAHFPKVMAHKADLCSKNIFWCGVLHHSGARFCINLMRCCGTTCRGVAGQLVAVFLHQVVLEIWFLQHGVQKTGLLHQVVADFCITALQGSATRSI